MIEPTALAPSGPVEPGLDLGGVEAQQVVPLEERNASLGDQSAHAVGPPHH